MTTRRLFDSQLNREIDVSENDVPEYLGTGRYRFLMGDKVPMLIRDVGYQMVGSDEAASRLSDKTGQYVDQETYRQKEVEQNLNTVGGQIGTAALGAVDMLFSELPSAGVGFAYDEASEAIKEYTDLDLGRISDYIDRAGDVSPWTYNLSGVAATALGGIVGGAFVGSAVPGAGTVTGGVVGGVTGVAKGVAQSQAKATAAKLARSGWTKKIEDLWQAVTGATKTLQGSKVGEFAAKTPAVWAMKVGNMKREQLTKILSDSSVNGALSKLNPGLAKMFKPVASQGKEAAKYAFGATATAGVVTAAAEGALFWGPTHGVSEVLLNHENMSLEDASSYIMKAIGTNAAFGAGASGVLDVGFKGGAILGGKTLDAAGKAYHYMGDSGVGQKVNEAWRATSRTFSGLDKQGQKNLDYIYAAGKEGHDRRKAVLHMKNNFNGEVVPQFEQAANMLWSLKDFSEQVSNGSFNHDFVTKTLRREIDNKNIEGDYLAAVVDAQGTFQQAEEILRELKSRPGMGPDVSAPTPEDARVIDAFERAIQGARAELGRAMVSETRTVTQVADADLAKVEEVRSFITENKEEILDDFITQYGIIFEDPDAAVTRTATGRVKKYFGDQEEGSFEASELSAELDPESTYESMLDEFDSVEDQIALESHPSYDAETGKILIEKGLRDSQWDALRGVKPERKAIQFNHDGHVYRWLEKEKRYVDARGNYLQKSPEYYKFTGKVWGDLPAHRAPYAENFIDVQGNVTQNPVQYESYVDPKTGELRSKPSLEEFEDYVDKDGITRVRPKVHALGKRPPVLSDSQRQHFSEELTRVESDVESLVNAQRVIEEQIIAAQQGAPVPMERIAGQELLAPLSESGVPAQLSSLDEEIWGIEFLVNEEIAKLPSHPPRGEGASGFDQHQAVVARQKERATVQARIDKLKKPLRELRKKRQSLVQKTGPELETILEIQNPRLSHELSASLEEGSQRIHDSLSASFDETVSAISSVPSKVKKLLSEEGYDLWTVFEPMHRIARSYDEGRALIDGSGGDRFSIQYAGEVKDQLLAQAERIEKAARESTSFLDGIDISFKGKKQIRKAVLSYSEKTAAELRGLATQAQDGIEVLEAWSTSPAAAQGRLDALGSQLGKVKADLHKRQLVATDLEGKLERLPPGQGAGQKAKAKYKYQEELTSARLKVKEARRAMNTHTEHSRLLRQDYDKIVKEITTLEEMRKVAPSKAKKKEVHFLLKDMRERAKTQLDLIKGVETRSWKSQKKKLHSALKVLVGEQDKIVDRGGPRASQSIPDAEYPTPLPGKAEGDIIEGGVERPSAARLSELSKGNITDAERATLHKMSGYKGGDRAFDHGKKTSKDPGDTRWQYDDDLIRFLEEQRHDFLNFGRKKKGEGGAYSMKGSRRVAPVGPGMVPGRDLDELGPDPLRGELGRPTARTIDDDVSPRIKYALKDKDGRLKSTGKGLGYDVKRFGAEGRPVEVFTKAEVPSLPPMEEFRRVISLAEETGDTTELENLMNSMGMIRDFEPYYGENPGTLHDLFGYKKREGTTAYEQAPSTASEIRAAVERIKNPTKETFEQESSFVSELRQRMNENRANHSPEELGDDLARASQDEDQLLQDAIGIAESTGDVSLLLELASRHKVSVKSPEQLADIFILMQKLKNEYHFVDSHELLGPKGQDAFGRTRDLFEHYLTGAAPRPVASQFPAGRNHFGSYIDNTGMSREVTEFAQNMEKFTALHTALKSEIGEVDPFARSSTAQMASQEKIRDLVLSMDKDNVHTKLDTLVAYSAKAKHLFNEIDRKHDVGKLKVRRTEKHNEAFRRSGISPSKDPVDTFKKMKVYSEKTNNKMRAVQRRMSSREFQAALEFGVRASGSSWSSALATAGIAGISLGAFFIHPMATVAAAMGLAAMNPRNAAVRLAQMEKMARTVKESIKRSTDEFVYESIMKKGRKYSSATAGFERPSIPRAFIGPSSVIRNAGELEEYQNDAAKREIASTEFLHTKKFISRLVSNENEMASFIDQAIPEGLDEYAPTIRKHMQDNLRMKIQAAYEAMPRTFASEFMSVDTLPSTMEMAQWARDLQAIEDPITTLIDGLSTGSLTSREVKMIQRTDPVIYRAVVENIVQALSDPAVESRINYRTKLHLETLLGVQFTRPSTVKYLQKAFQRDKAKQQEQSSFKNKMQSLQQSSSSTVNTVERSQ